MSIELAERMKTIKGSPTSSITASVARLREEGRRIISLNVGEPDFRTPEYICEAAQEMLSAELLKYTPGSGILPLRKAIADKLYSDNHLCYSPDDIVVSVGAKQALYSALMAIAGPGDEIIIPTPCYVSYPEMVRITGADVVLVPCNPASYQLDPSAIEAAITDRTKAIIICSPCNPTGAVYKENVLRKLADLAVRHDFFVISDEVYEKILYDEAKHISIASFSKEIQNRTILINGFSKSHAMTGWRIGYAAGPSDVISAIVRIQSQVTTCVSALSQHAALVAYTGPQADTALMVEEYARRRNYVVSRLSAMSGVVCPKIEGAFYVLFDIKAYLNESDPHSSLYTDTDFCSALLEATGVAMVPGTAFEAPGTIRLSFSTSMDILEESMDLLESFLHSVN